VGDNLADLSELFENRGDDLGFMRLMPERISLEQGILFFLILMYGIWLSEIFKHASGSSTRNKLVNMIKGF
jgi:hypothetical protein